MCKSPECIDILFVDDVPDTVDLFGALFSLAGYKVRVAYSGREALQLAVQLQPAVICSDLEMPAMSGFELAQALRSMPSLVGTFLISISGSDESELAEKSLMAGFDLCLQKPVAFQHLLQHIQRSLR